MACIQKEAEIGRIYTGETSERATNTLCRVGFREVIAEVTLYLDCMLMTE